VLPPAVVTVVLVLRQLGLAGTALGMIGVYTGMYLSTVIFFVTGFVRTIPIELEEAARIGGAGPLRVFTGVVLPMLSPVLATATILLNLFQVANAGLYLQNWHLIFAYVVTMSVPLLVVFLLAQRRIIAGVTSGAVE
jgi:raffinose/stachyose/melibiose transport system permease protein